MPDLRELYQETILDHNRSPRNFGTLQDANRTLEGYNPLCGDHFTLYLRVEEGIIREISFQGAGCAISKASASIMSTILKGKTEAEAVELFERFHEAVTGDLDRVPDADRLGKLAVFAGVREFPARVKCASLAWHTVKAALQGQKEAVSTE